MEKIIAVYRFDNPDIPTTVSYESLIDTDGTQDFEQADRAL
jgi:hypothetical protein